ncbi:MAG: glutamate racemase [Bacteroidota bacterium]
MSDSRPIGVFDSGVGGLSVWKEMIKILPFESVIYYADNKNCPYGNKSPESIIQLSSKVVDFLLTKDVKSIVVACNTATAAAIDHLRKNYTIPFIGMEPAVKPASLNSKTKSIAILATEGTFNGKLFRETSRKYARDVELNIEIGNDLVDIVEKGLINEQSTYNYLKQVVKPLVAKDIDHLVLGCTHFPFLIPVLQKVLPENVKIIDPAPAVAKQTFRVLQQKKILNQSFQKPQYDFYSSGQTVVLESILKDIFGFDIEIHAV